MRFAIADGGVGGWYVATYSWRSLNGRFSKLTSHLLKTGAGLYGKLPNFILPYSSP